MAIYIITRTHDDLAPEIKTTIEKYPYSTFPEKIVIGEVAPLKVIIKAVMPTPIKDTSMAQGTGTVKITVSQDQKEKVPVKVYVEQDNFEVVGGKYWNTILVPTATNEDSNPIIFDLKAKKEGKQDIAVQFFQQGVYIGEIKVNTIVLPTVPVNNSAPQQQQSLPSQEMIWDISKLPQGQILCFIFMRKKGIQNMNMRSGRV